MFLRVVGNTIKLVVASPRNVTRSKLVPFHARPLWVKTLISVKEFEQLIPFLVQV